VIPSSNRTPTKKVQRSKVCRTKNTARPGWRFFGEFRCLCTFTPLLDPPRSEMSQDVQIKLADMRKGWLVNRLIGLEPEGRDCTAAPKNAENPTLRTLSGRNVRIDKTQPRAAQAMPRVELGVRQTKSRSAQYLTASRLPTIIRRSVRNNVSGGPLAGVHHVRLLPNAAHVQRLRYIP